MTAVAVKNEHTSSPGTIEQWMSRKEAALFLRSIGVPISERTLANLASNNNAGKGPPYNRTRWKSVRYAKSDLIAWAKRETERVE